MPGEYKALFWRLMRFNLVGICATATYFLIGMGLSLFSTLPTMATHLIASAVSIVFSYCGHALFTFRRHGRRYVWRFALTTLLIFGLATALTEVCDRVLRLPDYVTVAIITVFYPALSFVLHNFWTFKEDR